MWPAEVTHTTGTIPVIAVPDVADIVFHGCGPAPVGPMAAMAEVVETIAAITVRHGMVTRRTAPVERGAAVWRVGSILARPSSIDDRKVIVTWYDTADTARTAVVPMTRVGLFGR